MDMDPLESPQEPPPRLLFRRACSLLLDSIVLIVLHAGLIYLVSQIINHPFEELVRTAGFPSFPFFCCFTTSTMRTSTKLRAKPPGRCSLRSNCATPFFPYFSCENHDPLAVSHLLNILNLAPVLAGKPLLLDLLSGTEIRSHK